VLAPVQPSRPDIVRADSPIRYKAEILTDEEAAALYAKAFPKARKVFKAPEPPPEPSQADHVPAKPPLRSGLLVAGVAARVLTVSALGFFLDRSGVLKALTPAQAATTDAAAHSQTAASSPAMRHVVIRSQASNWLSECSDSGEKSRKLLNSGDKL